MGEISLKEIDELIEKSDQFNSLEKHLTALSKLIVPFLELDIDSEITFNSLFIFETEHSKNRFIAFCLLRIYSKNPELIANSSLKHKIHKFFDQSIQDLYHQLHISLKEDNYSKASKLSSYVKTIENHLDSNINTAIDLHFINNYVSAYKSAIKQKQKNPILWQFFGSEINDQLFNNVFKIIDDYVNSEIKNQFELYNKAISTLDTIIDISKGTGTKYSILYIEQPFLSIKQKLIDDFKNNPYSRPALLKILKTTKKYPFSTGVNYKIQLLIENGSSGVANNTVVKIELYSDDIIKLNKNEIFVGLVQSTAIVEFEYLGIANSDNILIIGKVEWHNFNGEKCLEDFEILLEGQNTSVNWSEIINLEPYDLEPVTNESKFIGREKIITDLKKIGEKVTSSYIFGQRRVGKTSIVKTLQSIINAEDIFIIYIEAGDWSNATSPNKSLADLGKAICTKIIRHSKKFSSLNIPDFEGSFNRLTGFLDEILEIDSNFKLLIVLDEFDRVSNELLYNGETAKSFVLTIRSISNREPFGFILVGGEKLEYILSQWQEFNKFRPIRVDYFDKKTEWEDFKNLIRNPVNGILEISDKAIDYIYNQTSGNPYFTKKICIELFTYMTNNRDYHVTEVEAKRATDTARDGHKIAATDFSHFWKDGIKDKEEKEEEISINRRKILLSIGSLLKEDKATSKQAIVDRGIINGLSEMQASKTLEEFLQREIIRVENNNYLFVVKFFQDWLISNGLDKIITTFREEQILELRKHYDDQLRITHQELNNLSNRWPTYKGKEITTEILREWLDQFEGIENQRFIFTIIENIKFYSLIEIREKMELIFNEVRKEIKKAEKEIILKEGKRKRDDIIISYFDTSPVKSGAEYAKIFVETNNIYKDFASTPEKLELKLNSTNNINAILFVDDFIGTGQSIIENLNQIIPSIKDLIKKRKILVIIGAITGFQEAKHKIEEFALKNDFQIAVKLIDPLDNSNRCFNNDSQIFKKPYDREKAKSLCDKIGQNLEKNHPLGYGNCQSTVIFPNTCPNNSLPILWKETSNWKPLFKRG